MFLLSSEIVIGLRTIGQERFMIVFLTGVIIFHSLQCFVKYQNNENVINNIDGIMCSMLMY